MYSTVFVYAHAEAWITKAAAKRERDGVNSLAGYVRAVKGKACLHIFSTLRYWSLLTEMVGLYGTSSTARARNAVNWELYAVCDCSES